MNLEELTRAVHNSAAAEKIFLVDAVRQLSIDRLVRSNRRLRSRDAKTFGKLTRSIHHFGIVRPVLVGEHLNIIDGHGIVDAVYELRLHQAPVRC